MLAVGLYHMSVTWVISILCLKSKNIHKTFFESLYIFFILKYIFKIN